MKRRELPAWLRYGSGDPRRSVGLAVLAILRRSLPLYSRELERELGATWAPVQTRSVLLLLRQEGLVVSLRDVSDGPWALSKQGTRLLT